jgi:hypothetical protein
MKIKNNKIKEKEDGRKKKKKKRIKQNTKRDRGREREISAEYTDRNAHNESLRMIAIGLELLSSSGEKTRSLISSSTASWMSAADP